jgi:hypothetical protein
MRTNKSRFLDYTLYLLISMVAVASIFVPSVLNLSPIQYKRWVALIFAALIITGFVIEDSKTLWRKKKFWVFMRPIVVLNCVLLAMVVLEKIQVSGFMLMCICFIEICTIYWLKKVIVRT